MTTTASRGGTTRVRDPLRRAQITIWLALVVLTAAAWVLLIRHSADTGQSAGMTPPMGMGALPFLGVWLAMVVAMMFPSAAPMILMFARIAANRGSSGRPSAPTAFFVAGYVLVWSVIGVAAFLLAAGAEQLARRVDVVADHAGQIGALLIVVAGAYQFSALKDRCMTGCRSPLAFLSRHWREGARAAIAMGAHHGVICAGCCWALMAIMFPLGMMNVVALGAVTAFIYAEKVLPAGRILRFGAGVVLVALGLAALADPGLLPGGIAQTCDGAVHLAGTTTHMHQPVC
ncbi:DUF2182 domain-containing protein [Pseudonocardia sp.]|uniref:DUF2182 domain-containing protein n=1 Tax=Pseudonocardia sp. TaxID=60912 RepID=UPI003D0B03F3